MTQSAAPWLVLLLSVLGTYVWRAMGVVFSARIQPDSAFFQWISCVSYAMVAGLIARMTILPIGALAETPLIDRLGAMALGFAVFFAFKRRILPAAGVGVAAFCLMAYLREAGLPSL
ncbi:MAG: AzlD domain-containing protein [Pseudomonadota bacterium]